MTDMFKNMTNMVNMVNKYSKYIAIALFALIIYQLYLATFARENFDTKTKTSEETDADTSTNVTATSCTQFTTCSDCINGDVSRTNEGCYWNPTCKKCGSFQDEGYSRSCDDKSDPNVKCGSTTGDSRPIPQEDDNDNKEDSSIPVAFDETVFSSNIIPLPYNDFDGAKSIVGGAAGSENGCPVCPKLTLLKTPTYITTQV
jgi:hypothetical protein